MLFRSLMGLVVFGLVGLLRGLRSAGRLLEPVSYTHLDIHVGLLSCGMELPTYKYIIPLIAPKDNVVDEMCIRDRVYS